MIKKLFNPESKKRIAVQLRSLWWCAVTMVGMYAFHETKSEVSMWLFIGLMGLAGYLRTLNDERTDFIINEIFDLNKKVIDHNWQLAARQHFCSDCKTIHARMTEDG